MEENNVRWNEEEPMSKEFAIGVVDEMQRFCRRLYYQPTIEPFNNHIAFEATMKMLNGLREMIEASVKG